MMKRLVGAGLMAAALAAPGPAGAQGAASPLAGTWQGTVSVNAQAVRVGLVVTATPGGHDAYLVIIDQDNARVPAATVTLEGAALRLDLPAVDGVYDGVLDPAGGTIAGTLTINGAIPLTFARVDALDPPATFAAEENAAVRGVIERYFAAFTASDWGAYRTVLSAPFVLWQVGAQPEVVDTVDGVVARMRAVREGQPADYAVSRAARMVVLPLSAAQALVDVHWRRDRQDGSLLSEGAEVLPVVKTPEGWKITGNLPRALAQFGTSFQP